MQSLFHSLVILDLIAADMCPMLSRRFARGVTITPASLQQTELEPIARRYKINSSLLGSSKSNNFATTLFNTADPKLVVNGGKLTSRTYVYLTARSSLFQYPES
ncbi:hypothetical protein BgiBS90_019527 [Biomphalaria glabrata]|nr:hypothetical protein BgiBS90_019527 [Biomphalaria glabrata]